MQKEKEIVEISPNAKNESRTPLIACIEQGKLETIKLLIAGGVDVNEQDKNGNVPLVHSIVIATDVGLHSRYLTRKKDRGEDDYFMDADSKESKKSKCNEINEIIKLLVEAGANVDQVEKSSGFTPLTVASSESDLRLIFPIFKLLLENQANVNLMDGNGYTPLIQIIGIDSTLHELHLEMIELLLKNGANVNQKDRRGDIPLVSAIRCVTGHYTIEHPLNIIKLLLEYGADINQQNGYLTPLLTSINAKRTDIIEFLIAKGADVNLKHSNGENPLTDSIRLEQYHVSKLLIENGADLSEIDVAADPDLQKYKTGLNPYAIAQHPLNKARKSVYDYLQLFDTGVAKKRALLGFITYTYHKKYEALCDFLVVEYQKRYPGDLKLKNEVQPQITIVQDVWQKITKKEREVEAYTHQNPNVDPVVVSGITFFIPRNWTTTTNAVTAFQSYDRDTENNKCVWMW